MRPGVRRRRLDKHEGTNVDALLAVLVPILPQLGGGGLLFAFAIWRERAHNTAAALELLGR